MERRTFLGFAPVSAGFLLVAQNRIQGDTPGPELAADLRRERFREFLYEGEFWFQLEFPSPKTLPLLRKASELSPGVATSEELARIKYVLYHVERQDTGSRENIRKWEETSSWDLPSDQLLHLGHDFLSEGRFPEAFEAFRRANEASPPLSWLNYQYCWVGMAHVQYCQEQYKEGLELLDRYSSKSSPDPSFLIIPFYRVLFLCALCRKEQALTEARKFVREWGFSIESLAPALSQVGIDAYIVFLESWNVS